MQQVWSVQNILQGYNAKIHKESADLKLQLKFGNR